MNGTIKRRPRLQYEIKFWKEWLEADSLKRERLIRKTMIYRMLVDKKVIDKKIMKMTASGILNSYFEDLESAVYTKMKLEETV